jgi:cytochrome c
MTAKGILALASVLAIAFTAGAAAAEGDADAGGKVFRKCKACHVVDSDKNRVGPSLMGVVGRTAASVEGYKYSKAMKAFGEGGAVWDDDTMSAFLEKPKTLIKGTKMAFPGLKDADDRANLIAYLKQFSN